MTGELDERGLLLAMEAAGACQGHGPPIGPIAIKAILAAYLSASPAKAAETPEAVIANLARDLVALWRAQKIAGVSRADRNAAIEGVREKLIEAVDVLALSGETVAGDAEAEGRRGK